MCTPSSSAPSISGLMAGISARVRRYNSVTSAPKSPTDAGSVNGRISSADHQDFAADLNFFTAIGLIEKFRSGEDIGRVLAGHPQLQPFVGANAHEHRRVDTPEFVRSACPSRS